MSNFELPTNIRQIGSLDGSAGSLKIYVEDYVCTYLRQYAESGGHTEKIAFLVGKYMIIDGNPYVFINGVIQGKHSDYADNMECFTDESYDYAANQMAKHFAGSEIVGWMQSQPGYGVHLNPAYADYHMNNFTRPYQLLFVTDPIEKLNLFYAWNPEMSGIGEVGGYFIYYEQNKGMQEYMNANRISRVKTREALAEPPTEEKPPKGRLKIFDEIERKQTEEKKRPFERSSEVMGGMKTTPKSTQAAENRLAPKTAGKTMEDVRKLSNLLVGLCAVLFITVFIMGAGLLQSDSRIAALESAIIAMDSNYVVIVEQMRTLAALPVFAEQNQPMQVADGGTNHQGTPHVDNPIQTPLATPDPVLTPPPTPPPPEPTPTPGADNDDNNSDVDEQPDAVDVFANVPETYTIQPGDSLLGISRMFFGDITMVGRIMEINDILDPDHIVIGQIITLPRY